MTQPPPTAPNLDPLFKTTEAVSTVPKCRALVGFASDGPDTVKDFYSLHELMDYARGHPEWDYYIGKDDKGWHYYGGVCSWGKITPEHFDALWSKRHESEEFEHDVLSTTTKPMRFKVTHESGDRNFHCYHQAIAYFLARPAGSVKLFSLDEDAEIIVDDSTRADWSKIEFIARWDDLEIVGDVATLRPALNILGRQHGITESTLTAWVYDILADLDLAEGDEPNDCL
jgi:hypothetical protein